MEFKKKGEWHLSVKGHHVQCIYVNEQDHRFLVRGLEKHKWIAVNLSIPEWGVGEIIVEEQSDTSCFDKAVEIIKRR